MLSFRKISQYLYLYSTGSEKFYRYTPSCREYGIQRILSTSHVLYFTLLVFSVMSLKVMCTEEVQYQFVSTPRFECMYKRNTSSRYYR